MLEDFSQWIPVIQTAISASIAIVSWYYHKKTLDIMKRDRERPTIIETVRYCIAPLKESLSCERDYEELNVKERLAARRKSYEHFPDPDSLFSQFESTLGRERCKDEWEEESKRYNYLCKS